MNRRDIVVIGASAGGFEALKTLAAGLPADFAASVLVVWHQAPQARGILPEVLSHCGPLPATSARNREALLPGHIYVAPPDHHLLLEDDHLRTSHGPSENRFRPAADPLFRSAAYHYGPRVIGVVLSGALDDGASGLWTIKNAGGLAVVQDPHDAELGSMPEHALEAVAVDYCVRAAAIAGLLVRLTGEAAPEPAAAPAQRERIRAEIDVAVERGEAALALFRSGAFTAYTCPDCGGVLARFQDGHQPRFRCQTGHAFSPEALLTALTATIDAGSPAAVRCADDSVLLLNDLGDHYAEANQPALAALYFRKASAALRRAGLVRRAAPAPGLPSPDGAGRQDSELRKGSKAR